MATNALWVCPKFVSGRCFLTTFFLTNCLRIDLPTGVGKFTAVFGDFRSNRPSEAALCVLSVRPSVCPSLPHRKKNAYICSPYKTKIDMNIL